ncbi:cobyrinic acid a,c-diamide synthase [Marchantia polymorpha subsp. ruderalis]
MKTILVAGTNSGVGKTSIAVGLMAAFCRRGLRVQPFKVGPDFLDPMHHKAATGRDSYNLDGWMLSREVNLACFMRCTPFTDIAIVEGVMGLYDGRDGKSDSGSTAEMAKLLGTPVVLVLDCWQLARSAAALIRGYTSFDPDVKFAGVLLNKVGSSSHTAWLTEAILATEPDVRVLGGVPKSAGIELPEMHLGAHPPVDEEVPVNYIQRLADLIESHVDLDSILEQAVPLESVHGDILGNPSLDLFYNSSVVHPKPVRIGVARDDAFCFYYHENLLLLQNAGSELVEFSPLRDTLPPRLDGIYFGGGYPELHLEQLSSNKRLLYGIRAFANAGGVIFAECGGLMYLSQGIEDDEQRKWSMCGVFPFWTRMQPVMHMGYVTVTPQDNCVLFPASIGEIRGQIFHFSEMFYANSNTINLCPKGFCTKAEYRKAAEDVEGYMHGNTMASFVHLHFGSNPAAAVSFVERCRMDSTKAAAVAAASASAVAGAGPVAAAAAGAAAAAAVAEAMGETKSLIPYQSVGDNSDLFLRRSGSFDLSSMKQHYEGRRNNGRLVRSESEIWVGQLDQENNSYSKLGGEITRSEDYNRRVSTKAGFASTTGKAYNSRDDVEDINSNVRGRHGNSLEKNLDKDNLVQGGHRKHLPPLTANRRTFGWLVNGEVPKHLEKVPSGSRFSSSSPTSRALPERIVSLSPSATEILYELGAGKRLIGVTESCVRPSGCSNELYNVCRTKVEPGSRMQTYVEVPKPVGTLGNGSSMRLDVSWLCKAKPDLIIIQDSSLHGDTCSTSIVGILAQAGLQSGKNTQIMILRPHTVADAISGIVELGDRVGLYHEACLLADWLRSRLRKAAVAVARLHRPRVLVLHSLDPLIMGGHWVPEMESLAGGLDDLQKPGCNAETLLWRRITNYAPEVLIFAHLTPSAEQTLSEVQKIVKFSGFWSLPAVEAGRVYICEHIYFSYPGPKLVDGVELLVGMLHPSASQSWQVPGAVLKLSLTPGQKCSPDQISKHFQPC